MVHSIRIATAVVLALAVPTLPVVLDQCAESCAAHGDAVAATPACHHTTSRAVHIGRAPIACGHDHNGMPVTIGKRDQTIGRALSSLAPSVTAFPAVLDLERPRPVSAHSPPGLSTLGTYSLPLRI